MKNCDEMVNSLLERRNQYLAEQKRKRAVLIRTVTSMCCVCLIALLSFGMRQGEIFNAASQNQTIDDAIYPGIKDTFIESKGESANNPADNNKIVVHSIEHTSSSNSMDICLLIDDFVEMTREEMIEYYGVDYIPDVPADIKPWKNERSGTFRKDGGTGAVYWDVNILNYANADFTRTVHLKVQKGRKGFVDFFYFKGTEERSVINNVEVLIGLSEKSCYCAEFMYKGVGFLLYAEGVTEAEFIGIIESILN